MSIRDLYETIRVWLGIYRDISRPDSEEHKLKDRYKEGLLKVAAALYIVSEIEKTPVEKHLKKAIEEAQSGDFDKLNEISLFLSEVENYLNNKDLH